MTDAEVHKLLIFLKRKPGTSLAEFREHYERRHVPLCLRYMAGPLRYRRRYIEPTEGLPEPDFDVITELWFADAAMRDGVIAAMAADRMPADVIADEERFLDRSKSRFHAVSEVETELEQSPA